MPNKENIWGVRVYFVVVIVNKHAEAIVLAIDMLEKAEEHLAQVAPVLIMA